MERFYIHQGTYLSKFDASYTESDNFAMAVSNPAQG
jgi:hypothetical protein